VHPAGADGDVGVADGADGAGSVEGPVEDAVDGAPGAGTREGWSTVMVSDSEVT